MIDEAMARKAVGDKGFEVYRSILDELKKPKVIENSVGRIGGKLTIYSKIEGIGSLYVDIYSDGCYINGKKISHDDCLDTIRNFLRK